MHFCTKKDPPTGRSLGRIAFPGRTATVTAISQCRDRTCGIAVGGRMEICGFLGILCKNTAYNAAIVRECFWLMFPMFITEMQCKRSRGSALCVTHF